MSIEEEAVVPSLFNLCIDAIKTQLIHRGDNEYLEENIFEELPSDLFDILTMRLPPMSLHKLQLYIDSTNDGLKNGGKRGRYGDFDAAWKLLFKTRWPEGGRWSHPKDLWKKQGVEGFELKRHSSKWHQMYWESHLQDCFDEAAEKAFLPSFDKSLGEIIIPGSIMKSIGHESCISDSTCGCSKLSYHCQEYGCYARCLRLQSVLCVAETCQTAKFSSTED